ncbi:MAG: type II toxin-antitoxin system prevent-host-death family antitoxin [Terracidiphilus sp.]
MRTVAVSEFKAKCLGLVDEVKATGQSIRITKRGKVYAWLTPPQEESIDTVPVGSLFGRLRHMVTLRDDVDLVSSEFTDEEWESTDAEGWERAEQGKRQ